MCAAIGIPTTRVSDLFIRQRMLSQVRSDQLAVFQAQQEIASGHRIQLPSEDPQAALRIMSYQRLLERRAQVQVNLATNQSYLTATDSAMEVVSNLLTDVRGVVLGAMGTTASDVQRAAAAQQVLESLRQLTETGNQKFRGRYLFAGSQTATTPFEAAASGAVRYNGDENHLESYSDLDLLFQTNMTGQEVFGGLSDEVRSQQDLTPIVTANTRLADLNGGRGIAKGSIEISDGLNHSRTLDLSGAVTVGDVAAMLHTNPPGAGLDVEITSTGLRISLPGGGNLSIRDAAEGSTAADLGIAAESAGATLTGGALSPRLLPTTRLDDIPLFGTRARALLRSAASDNDLVFEAGQIGSTLNGANIVIENDASVTAGQEQVSWDAGTSTLRVKIHSGLSIASDIAAAVHAKYLTGEAPIDASVDPVDNLHGGAGLVFPTTATLTGGSGEALDRSSGLKITNGGLTTVVTFDSAVTVEDLLNRLNLSEVGVSAAINAQRNGIDVRSRLSGCDFSIGENDGQTATELGLRTFTEKTIVNQLNYGAGIGDGQPNGAAADFSITLDGGFVLHVDVDGATDIQEILRRINEDPGNVGGRLTARLAVNGNGIELVDNQGPGTITVAQENLSRVANRLGLIDGQETSQSVTTAVGPATFQGRDVNPLEASGVFTALARLHQALLDNDQVGLERGMALLDRAAQQVSFNRASLAARQQGLDSLKARQDNEEVELQSNLSQDLDADYVQAVSDFTGRQMSFQASLQAAASIFKMTLLDYL